ncbi:MAG TPA: UvrD-helicase domain-containing protein [Acidimicrobiales bacterium]|nr:UvrD-helicase domain-containing protein [Acidimicrobiales bacterium]
MKSVSPFDVAELPGGRLLIEASAGTGKTHALTGLAVHLLGRGEVTVDQLLVVTYTRLATGELRGRIRTTLVGVRDELESPDPEPGLAAIVEALRAWDRDAARANLTDALARYDALTVTTIHSFAQRALASFGTLAGLDVDFGVLADSSRLIADAAADECAMNAQQIGELRAAAARDGTLDDLAAVAELLPKSTNAVSELATTIDGALDLRVLPDVDETIADPVLTLLSRPDVSSAAVQALLARRAAGVVAARRLGAGLRSYGELITGVREALDGVTGKALEQRLGEQYRVALIDEFQDTDRVQWDIFDRCFGRKGGRLILVGDPKQAIYGFRGANIHTYSGAANQPGMARRMLATNWRSDGDLLTGLETLMTGATFGDGIEFVAVGAAPGNEGTRLRRDDDQVTSPVEVTLADTDALKDSPEKSPKFLSAAIAEQVIATYVVDHVVDLLDHAWFDDEGTSGPTRRVEPGDIALLVRRRSEGAALAEALQRAAVPAVVRGNGDVRASSAPGWSNSPAPSRAAAEWRLLLEAVADPADPRRARAAAVGVFGPLPAPWALVGADEEVITGFQRRLSDWAGTLARSGAAAFSGRVWAESSVVTRVLATPDGDRLMTDLEHLGELFTTELGTAPAAPDRLLGLLAVPGGDQEDGADRVTQRRIPTGAPAVTIMTLHGAKGLEFPIVGCIGMQKLDPSKADRSFDPVDGHQVIDLAKGPEFVEAAKREQREEAQRLLYVGLTRARHHTFTCWTHEKNSPPGALTRLLFARDGDGSIDVGQYVAEKFSIPAFVEGRGRLEGLAARSRGTLGVRVLGEDDLTARSRRWAGNGSVEPGQEAQAEGDGPRLSVATLDRPLDRRAGRWSFTAITAHGDPAPDDDSPTESGGDENPHAPNVPASESAPSDLDGSDAAPTEDAPAAVSPLAWLPAGTEFGTLVHAVLEQVDFAGDEVADDLRRILSAQQATRRLSLRPIAPDTETRSGEELCVAGLLDALATPLGPLWDDRRLKDLATSDRLSECDFDLRLDAPAARPVTATIIGGLTREHLDSDDPYTEWAEALARGRFAVDLAGHLTGSIDLVARVGSGDTQRFVVSDYKTNRLHAAGEVPASGDYGPDALVRAMVEHDYPLQALLYSVALHRYLRWRLPGYDPAVHLGGVTYLFLRGMTPDAAARAGDARPGVASWRIPPTLIEALDARFAGRGEPR